MGGKIKECLIFIKEMFNIKDPEKGNPGINLESVLLIVVLLTFCTTVIFESLGIGIVPRIVERVIDVSFGYLIHGRGSKALDIIRRKKKEGK